MIILSYFKVVHLALFAEYLWAKSSDFNRELHNWKFCMMSKDFQISPQVQVGHLNLLLTNRKLLGLKVTSMSCDLYVATLFN